MQLQCNSAIEDYTCCPEVQPILKYLKALKLREVLEIGAGIGRVSVYLRNLLDWNRTLFYLLDGNRGTDQIAGINYELKKDFYNSFSAAEDFCLQNGIKKDNLFLIDADDFDFGVVNFDLCYSFKAIGFHWPINGYLEKIHKNMKKDSMLFFELRNPKMYKKERWKRLQKFVIDQIVNIDDCKYDIVEFNVDLKFPILVLKCK